MLTVLLVGSVADERAMYAEYLRLSECRAIEAENTWDALSLAPMADVIVTAVRVQGPFDGIDLVQRLRTEPATEHKAILVVTSCSFEAEQRRAHAAGCDVFLPKPCLPDLLLAAIQRAWASRASSPRGPSRSEVRARVRRRSR